MTDIRCARCGREPRRGGQPPGNRLTAPADHLGVAPGTPWASFEGQDVCPQCQTADERDAAARRVVEGIEREIQRRRAEGIPPDPYEPSLIAFAMGSRAGAEADPTESQPDETASPDAPERPDGRRLRIAITGAFLTGHPLAVRAESYGDLQRALGRSLKGPQWRVDGLRVRDGTYESGGGFTEALPLIIARRDGADLLPWLAAALEELRQARAGGPDRTALRLEATPITLGIDIYDLGVAVLTAWFDVTATGNDFDATARAVKQLVRLREGDNGHSPLAAALQQMAFDAAAQYGEAVVASAPVELQAAWLSRTTPPTPHPAPPPDERGRLLWLHPIHVLHAPERAEPSAQDLAPAFHRLIALDGGVFAAGIGWSAVVVALGSRAEDTPVRLTELHWAYYALYMEIDRGLLGVLSQQRWIQRASLKELEADADDVFADYLRVMDARARLDSHLSALGGDELAIWETIAQVQRFDAVADAVDRKLEVLNKLAQRRVEQASVYRARRLGDILGFLTALTIVTVAVALLGAFLGSRTPGIGSVWVRVAIVAAALTLSALLYWAAFVRTTRARSLGAGPRRS